MAYTEEDKKYILNEHLETIYCISDKEYQKRVWIRGQGEEVDDFDETVCHFFDDGDPILKNYKSYPISENQYKVLCKFRSKFKGFSDRTGVEYYLPELFIDTPEWEEVVNSAKQVLKAFSYKKS